MAHYLTFRLGQQMYGVAVEQATGVVEMLPITPIPRMPPHVTGIMNLRGNVVTVVDLRRSMGEEGSGDTEDTSTVIFEVHRGETPISIGGIVDEVAKVLSFSEAEMEPPPALAATGRNYVQRIGKKGDRVYLLLDMERVLALEEILP